MQALRAKMNASRLKADEAKSSQEQSRSNNRVLDGLTRLKTQGRISGFHVSHVVPRSFLKLISPPGTVGKSRDYT